MLSIIDFKNHINHINILLSKTEIRKCTWIWIGLMYKSNPSHNQLEFDLLKMIDFLPFSFYPIINIFNVNILCFKSELL